MTTEQGPFVIVNRYTGEAWRDPRMDARFTNVRAQFSTREDAQQYASVDLDLDADESTVMSLAQYLIEYGEQH